MSNKTTAKQLFVTLVSRGERLDSGGEVDNSEIDTYASLESADAAARAILDDEVRSIERDGTADAAAHVLILQAVRSYSPVVSYNATDHAQSTEEG